MITIDELEYRKQEFSECFKSDKIFSMSNESLADELYLNLSKDFPSLKLYKTPSGQNFTFGKKSEKAFREKIKNRINELKTLIAEYEKLIE